MFLVLIWWKKCNSDQWWNTINVFVSVKIAKRLCGKDYIWNLATSSFQNGKYLASIIDDSAITCDEIIDADAEVNSNNKTKSNGEQTKTFPKCFNEKKKSYKTQNFLIFLPFY